MQAAVSAMNANQVVAVAYSGGRDSAALLHATLMSTQASGWQVVALHINHGLSAHAGEWERFCADQCAAWAAQGLAVRFASSRLSTRPQTGDSIEAWARRERYAALRTMAVAHGASVLLLAHHRRDQAETLLLQALRSAGVAGLAGMPRQIERDRAADALGAAGDECRARHVGREIHRPCMPSSRALRNSAIPAAAGSSEASI